MNKNQSQNRDKMAFTEVNYRYLLISIFIIFVGLILMIGGGTDSPELFDEEALFSFRRITLAPIVIIGGLVFAIYAIFKKDKSETTTKE